MLSSTALCSWVKLQKSVAEMFLEIPRVLLMYAMGIATLSALYLQVRYQLNVPLADYFAFMIQPLVPIAYEGYVWSLGVNK